LFFAYNRLLKNPLDRRNGVSESSCRSDPPVCASPCFGQAAVQPQAGTLNRVFQRPVVPLASILAGRRNLVRQDAARRRRPKHGRSTAPSSQVAGLAQCRSPELSSAPDAAHGIRRSRRTRRRDSSSGSPGSGTPKAEHACAMISCREDHDHDRTPHDVSGNRTGRVLQRQVLSDANRSPDAAETSAEGWQRNASADCSTAGAAAASEALSNELVMGNMTKGTGTEVPWRAEGMLRTSAGRAAREQGDELCISLISES